MHAMLGWTELSWVEEEETFALVYAQEDKQKRSSIEQLVILKACTHIDRSAMG